MTDSWPELPYNAWRETADTLHMWTQIVGKTRLALAPMENHWWQVVLYLTPRGLTTSPIPDDARTFAVDFDFIDHALVIRTSDGATRSMALAPRTVADFYAEYRSVLRDLEIAVKIWPNPVEVAQAIPFAKDREHKAYDAEYAHRFWQILAESDRVLKRYRGQFLGKSSPVHFFWGAMDLAVTRFSGRPGPRYSGSVPNCPSYVMVEGYSHECASCGFWPGNDALPEPAYYAYAYPQPPGYGERSVEPAGAYFHAGLGEFVLPYEAVRKAPSPDRALLAFANSTYAIAADLAKWDRQALERP
ncbi:MAG TPA: DUF5996 family protein [Gemmatimonadaceae bacterium]|nr:DUF5996 family protein [Gemmatimonadaceae bacterium]